MGWVCSTSTKVDAAWEYSKRVCRCLYLPMPTPAQHQELAAQVNFDPDVFSIIEAESPTFIKKLELVQYWYEDEESAARVNEALPDTVQIQRNVDLNRRGSDRFMKLQLDGVFFEIDSPAQIPVVAKLRALLPAGYLSITLDFKRRQQLLGEDWRVSMESTKERSLIGIVKLTDHYQLLSFFGTGAGNYGLGNDDIEKKLREWEKLCELEILGGSGDTLILAFKTLPEDLLAFAEDMYAFCPDLIDQGYIGPPLGEGATQDEFFRAMDEQTAEDLADYLERNKFVKFWWD